MPLITFQPGLRTARVARGTSLLDAATHAGVTIRAPCGGEGTCGECRARVESGAVEQVARGCLSQEETADGWILACSSRIAGDVTVRVTEEETATPAQIVSGAAEQRPDGTAGSFTGRIPGREGTPPTTKHCLQVEPGSLESPFSDFERLTRAVERSIGIKRVATGLHVLRELAAVLRARDGRITVTIDSSDEITPAEIVRIEPGDATNQQVGLAIDVGTTTCAVSLVDVARRRVFGTAANYNGQLARGADIISRINYARTSERIDELRSLVLHTLNGLIDQLCVAQEVVPEQIDSAVIAGNTTMMHLLLGLPPEHIRLEPYTPTVNRPPRLRGGTVGLAMNPEAYVRLVPGVGSYVGGDITAGLLQTALPDEGDQIRFFLDIGTNGEVVVGNGEWLMACAASAGPAFEGGGVSCGMRAGTGAIERVRVDPDSGRADITVIGGGRPRGICGSGMIDLLAELWAADLLDPSGKLQSSCSNGRIRPAKGSHRNLAYTVVSSADTETGKAIEIDERDIQNLLRTKAAVYSACAVMLNSLGLGFDCVAEVYVAGGFGRFLDLEKSIAIGLLPDLPLERFTYLGNSALAGARAMLCNASAWEEAGRLAERMTYLELNVDPAYMNEYTAALFLPHTDLDRFPTVKAGLAARRSNSEGTPP
ncbi:MAG: DUF4445 domain-containing protein [Phycisphaerales bacterium]|nr:MAG: DUF4445 domain-containing protein [Phycisphaerales bacterium]